VHRALNLRQRQPFASILLEQRGNYLRFTFTGPRNMHILTVHTHGNILSLRRTV